MVKTIFQYLSIPCMIITIIGIFMMCFIPDNPIIKFLEKHKRMQILIGIMFYLGLIASFIAVLI